MEVVGPVPGERQQSSGHGMHGERGKAQQLVVYPFVMRMTSLLGNQCRRGGSVEARELFAPGEHAPVPSMVPLRNPGVDYLINTFHRLGSLSPSLRDNHGSRETTLNAARRIGWDTLPLGPPREGEAKEHRCHEEILFLHVI